MKGHGRILREVERTLAGIPAVIRYKNIKNLYLRVSADGSRIELSVPRRTLQLPQRVFIARMRQRSACFPTIASQCGASRSIAAVSSRRQSASTAARRIRASASTGAWSTIIPPTHSAYAFPCTSGASAI